MSEKQEYVYDINKKHSDKSSKRFLLSCHLFKKITSLFVSTFLIGHIYSFSGDIFGYIRNVAVFNIFVYLSMMLFYMLFSIFVDKTNRVIFYRISVVVTTALVILIITFGQQLAQLLILAGSLHGLSEALYYSSYNVIKEEMVGKSSIGKYVTLTTVLLETINTICPILLGILIDVTTYSETAIIVFVLCAIQFGLTYGIKCQRPKDSHYSLKEYKQQLKLSPVAKELKFLYIICLVYGVTSLTSMLINVYVMMNFGSNFSLGAVTAIYSLVAVLSILLLKKFTTPRNRKPVFILFTSLIILAGLVFVIKPCKATVIILNIVIAMTAILHSDLIETYRFSILKKAGLYDQIAEHQTVIENRFNISRTLSFIFLLIVSFFKNDLVLSIFVMLVLTILSSVQILLLFFEKKHIIPQLPTEQTEITKKSEEKTEEDTKVTE